MVDGERSQPRHAALRDHDEHGFDPAAELAPERRQSGHAGRVQQAENEEAHRRGQRKERTERRAAEVCADAHENTERAYYGLLGHEAGDKRRRNAPVAEAEGCKYRGKPCSDDGKQTVSAPLSDDVEANIEVLQEPYDDSRSENDGERAADEIPCLFPHEQQHGLKRWHAVVWKLHDEGHGLAGERRFAQNLRRYYSHEHAKNIQAGHDEAAVIREKCRCEHSVDGYLRRAAHKRDEQHRHFAVALGGQRARCHDGRNGAAEAYEHRNKAAPRQSDAAQKLIHNKRNARHIARILQNGEEEKQHDDNRQKAQHAAHAGKNAVNYKAVHYGVQSIGSQRIVHKLRHAVDAQREKIRQPLAQNAERHPEYKAHDGYERRDGKVFVREHLVYFNAAQHLPALVRLDDALGAHGLDKAVSHIGESRVAVKPALGLHFEHGMAY